MFSLFQHLSLRYISHHRVRAMLIILSIALGVGTWVATDALQGAMEQSAKESANPSTGADLYVSNDITKWVSRSLQKKIEAVEGVGRADARVIYNIAVYGSGIGDQKTDKPSVEIVHARLFGVDLRGSADTAFQDWSKLDVTVKDEEIQTYSIAQLMRQAIPALKLPPPVLIGEELGRKIGKDRRDLTVYVAGRKKKLFIAGRIQAKGTGATLGGNVIVMDGEDASLLLGQPGQATRFDIAIAPGADRKRVQQRLQETIIGGEVQTPEGQNERIQNLIRGMETSFRICGAGALVVGMFLVFNALSISVVERRHEIGVLRSIGATRSQVRTLFLLEAAVLGVIGTALGIPMGIGLAHLSFGWIQSIFEGIFTRVAGGEVQTSTSTVITASIGGVATSLLAALLPASQTASEEPADTVRRAPFVTARAYRLLQVGTSFGMLLLGAMLILLKPYLSIALIAQSALVLCAVGAACLGLTLVQSRRQKEWPTEANFPIWYFVLGILLVFFGGMAWLFQRHLSPEKLSYVGFVLILLGVMLATPMLTALVTRLIQPVARACLPIASRLAADNLVRSPGRTGLVIAALTAGVAMMVQTAGTIVSNEDAFSEWVERSYRADLFVTAGGPFSSSGLITPMDRAVEDELGSHLPAGTKMVASCYRYPNYDSPAVGKTKIFLTLTDAGAHYRINKLRGTSLPHLELYKRLAEEPGHVLVSENFAFMHRVFVGDSITLPGAQGPVQLHVLGIVEEYQWNRGSLTIDLNHYKDAFGARTQAQSRDLAGTVSGLGAAPGASGAILALPHLAFGGSNVDAFEVYLPEPYQTPGSRERLLKELGAKHALVVLTRPELQGKIRDLLRRIYGVAYTQELLVGIVAVLGVVTALLISVLGRRRELGLIRAVGGTRGQLLQTILAEALLIGIVGTLLGILVGIPLEHYVVRVVLFDEAGYLFPVRIPWTATAIIAGVAIFCSTLAGIGPAIHAMRLKITDAIAYE